MNTDVLIVGNGVSGLVLSILLKRKNIDHIVLNRVEKRKTLELPETLPPSTLGFLESLNLLELFSKSSSKTFGYHSIWGSDELNTDSFFNHNPYKYGLKLSKRKLLQDLTEIVPENVLPFDRLIKLEQNESKIRVEIESNAIVQNIQGRIIIDATGRNRSILKQLGVFSETFDNQVALSCHLPYFKHHQLIHPVYSESFEHGWGIVSSLNEEVNCMTLYTEKGSSILPHLKDYHNWKELLSKTIILKDFLSEDENRKVFGGDSNSSKASQISGSNWLAIGDSAMGFDPLSSHGISNAIYTANLASQAIEDELSENSTALFRNYGQTLTQIFKEYLERKSKLYDSIS
jgi:flavin-dependent dehydrogenase